MKKIKKVIVIALVTTMLLGSTLTVNAAMSCLYCGKNLVASTPTGTHCNTMGCNAPVTFYACSSCHSGWYMCSNWDMN